MSTGLIAILDDVVGLAKVAAASVDDAAVQATKAGTKAVGIVIDDAAVTPRYAVGFAPSRELPIIGKIALGSLWNKLAILLPGALLLSWLAPWAITPLLMAGGVYLCLEGYEKLAELFHKGNHGDHHDGQSGSKYATATSASDLENEKVQGAIRTDFILSAEIMAIALATIETSTVAMKAAVLGIVGIGMTALVYGVVAIIVKADDVGLAMAGSSSGFVRAVGRAIVKGMPYFLSVLSFVGMMAMLWVGGGIIIHGLAVLGYPEPEHIIHDAAHAVAQSIHVAGPVVQWLVAAVLSGLFGVVVGAVAAPLVHNVGMPLVSSARRLIGRG